MAVGIRCKWNPGGKFSTSDHLIEFLMARLNKNLAHSVESHNDNLVDFKMASLNILKGIVYSKMKKNYSLWCGV